MKLIAIALVMMATSPTMAQSEYGDITVDAQMRARGEIYA